GRHRPSRSLRQQGGSLDRFCEQVRGFGAAVGVARGRSLRISPRYRCWAVWQQREAARGGEARAGGLATRAGEQGVLLALLREARIGDGTVLDLGVGSGLVAEVILDALPEASLVGVDFSDAMLEVARARLDRFGSRVRLVSHDLAAIGTIALPAARY